MLEHTMQAEAYVEMNSIVKRFAGVVALKNANLSLRKGEIHALMGENGAGKSTLIKVLAGAHAMDEGTIRINGKKVEINSPKDGKSHGISVIYQEFALAKDLTVAENIFLERINHHPIIKWKQLYTDAKALLSELGFGEIDVEKPVSGLSVAYQQVVEICKALSGDVKVLVLDEPTAVLTSNEVERLFELLIRLRGQGVSIVYVSHRLEEIFRLSDRITIMKDGEYVETVNTVDITEGELVTKMIGREPGDMYPKRDFSHSDEVALWVENACAGKMVRNVSFEVRAGEVLGFSGLIGSGRTETMRAIFGADKLDSGKVYIGGTEAKIRSPKVAVQHGFGLLPEDRKAQGVLLHLPILQNISLSSLKRFTSYFGVIFRNKERTESLDLAKQLTVKAASIDDDVSTLSGGNQQKVALAKWVAAGCDVLVLDEPTRGVDVGAKAEIYKVVNELARKGLAIIIISSEMPEIIGMSDRVLVMRNGSVAGELTGDEINEHNLIRLAMGVQ